MLVLTRKSEESVIIGPNIEVKILAVRGDQVSLGFIAPDEVTIYRKEVYEAIQTANRQAAHVDSAALMRAAGTIVRKPSNATPATERGDEMGNTRRTP